MTHRRSTPLDVREAPAYTFAETSRYLAVPPATVRAWVAGIDGKQQFTPLIHRPDHDDKRLSFNNLVEIHVLRALRTEHGVAMDKIRDALTYAERKFGVRRLLIHEDLKTAAGDLFLDRYLQLINLNRSGQFAIKEVLKDYLKQVVYDPARVPLKMYLWRPVLREHKQAIVLDPRVGFGVPITASRGISTAVIARRYDAGESIEALAADYALKREEVEDAIRFERAA